MDKPWKDVCAKRCYYAKHDPCRCRCKGQNHQKGLLKTPETLDEFEKLAMLKSKKLEVTEKICNFLEIAMEKHPEWKKHLEP